MARLRGPGSLDQVIGIGERPDQGAELADLE